MILDKYETAAGELFQTVFNECEEYELTFKVIINYFIIIIIIIIIIISGLIYETYNKLDDIFALLKFHFF